MPKAFDLRGKRFGRLMSLRVVRKPPDFKRYWECRCDCGQMTYVVTADLTRRRGTKSCGCLKSERGKILTGKGEKSLGWKGGRTIKSGYVYIHTSLCPEASPRASYYLLEHRVIMERKLGRNLKPGEEVHHIDGVRANNDVNNLHLFRNSGYHRQWHRRLEEISTYD